MHLVDADNDRLQHFSATDSYPRPLALQTLTAGDPGVPRRATFEGFVAKSAELATKNRSNEPRSESRKVSGSRQRQNL